MAPRLNPFDKLRLDQAAEIIGISQAEVRTLIFKGQLRAVKIGDKRRVRRDQVMAYKAKADAALDAA